MDDRMTVAVYGATGHTGRFVVAELARRGVRAIRIGRDAARLAEDGGDATLAR
ncbi:saccharopine dehydrogenase, partial [Burkholderia sp. Ac-20384]|nr:saccharopine dehydrogenase [Burkholderia sp. Ac-20384]